MDLFDKDDLYSELNNKLSGGAVRSSEITAEDKPERSEEGGLWFVVLTPLIGLVLQAFAVSKWAGIYLWAMIVIALVLGTVFDYRSVRDNHPGYDTASLKKYILLPPVYVYQRERLLGHETYKAFVLGALIFAALSMNNFVSSLRINTDSIPALIESSTVGSLDNFNGSSSENIGDRLAEWLGEDYTSECTKSEHTYTAVFTGKHDSKAASVEIKAVHDGFVYKSFEVTAISVDGKKLDDESFKEKLKEIFVPEGEDAEDSEDEAEDGSEEAVGDAA